jgi:hypothetical protein
MTVSGGPVTASGSLTIAYASGIQAYTTAEAAKLGSIDPDAQVNVATDLSYDAASRELRSSTGADVTLPLVASGEAGLAPASGGGTSNFLRADGTWAAPAGGGGSFPSPGLTLWSAGSGSMLAPTNCRGLLGNAPASLGTVDYHQIYIPEAITATQLICRTHSTYVGTTDVLLGIYNNSQARPSTKIVDAALQITANGAATYAVAISQSLSPGWYWLAFLATALGATPAFGSTTSNNPGIGGGLFGEYTNAGTPVNCVRQTDQTALPATADSLSVSAAARPAVFLGV